MQLSGHRPLEERSLGATACACLITRYPRYRISRGDLVEWLVEHAKKGSAVADSLELGPAVIQNFKGPPDAHQPILDLPGPVSHAP